MSGSSEQPTPEPHETKSFGAYAVSSRDARRFVGTWLRERELGSLAGVVTLCVSELSTNAVLHTAQPFSVSIGGSGSAVRVAVIDSAPHRVPVPVPRLGSARDITDLSETGRGLVVVAALASRWGIRLAAAVKTVWCQFDVQTQPVGPTDPEIVDERPAIDPPSGVRQLRFEGLPVRAAISSGLDVENAVRDLELTPHSKDTAFSEDGARLLALIERSASSRLAGRHAAMHAAGNEQLRFDFTLAATDDELMATAELAEVLAQRAPVAAPGPGAAVKAFRSWLTEEVARQMAGEAPTRCPLPD